MEHGVPDPDGRGYITDTLAKGLRKRHMFSPGIERGCIEFSPQDQMAMARIEDRHEQWSPGIQTLNAGVQRNRDFYFLCSTSRMLLAALITGERTSLVSMARKQVGEV